MQYNSFNIILIKYRLGRKFSKKLKINKEQIMVRKSGYH